jgi:hypothetical protein
LRHDSVLNHIAGCLNYALVSKSSVELYYDLDELQAPGGGSTPADVMVQAQRPDLVILDQLMHGRYRIAEKCKTSKYADLKTALSTEGWDCSLYIINIGARGHILKDRLRSLFWLGSLQGIG